MCPLPAPSLVIYRNNVRTGHEQFQDEVNGDNLPPDISLSRGRLWKNEWAKSHLAHQTYLVAQVNECFDKAHNCDENFNNPIYDGPVDPKNVHVKSGIVFRLLRRRLVGNRWFRLFALAFIPARQKVIYNFLNLWWAGHFGFWVRGDVITWSAAKAPTGGSRLGKRVYESGIT